MKCNHLFAFSLAMLLTLAPFSAFADDEGSTSDEESSVTEEAAEWSYSLLSDGTAQVLCTSTTATYAEVPSEIDGHTVTALADECFYNCTILTSVTLPDTLTSIGDDAFYCCINLESITIPDSVTNIGDTAFYACILFESITIPASVEHIGTYCFDGTEAMTEFIVDVDNTAYTAVDGVLYTKDYSTLIKYPEAKEGSSYTVESACENIADWAFVGTLYIEEIDLQNVTYIGEDAFYYCMNLRKLAIPEGVAEINGIFAYCISLESVTLPSTLEKIGTSTFYNCSSLTSIVLPDSLTYIGSYAFFQCESLTSLTIPDSVVTVTDHCIGYGYDSDTSSTVVQENFTLYCSKDSPAYEYAKSAGITWESHQSVIDAMSDTTKYTILLSTLAVIILGLIIAIVVVAKNIKKMED